MSNDAPFYIPGTQIQIPMPFSELTIALITVVLFLPFVAITSQVKFVSQ